MLQCGGKEAWKDFKKTSITKTSTKHQSIKLQGGMKRKQQQQQWRHERILGIFAEVQLVHIQYGLNINNN